MKGDKAMVTAVAKKVLVVEDDKDILQLVKCTWTMKGSERSRRQTAPKR